MSTLKEDLRKTIPTLQRNSILMHVHLSSQKYLLHVQDCMAFMILCTATYITEFFLKIALITGGTGNVYKGVTRKTQGVTGTDGECS